MKKQNIAYIIQQTISIIGAILAIVFIIHNIVHSELEQFKYNLFYLVVFYFYAQISIIKHDLKIKTMEAKKVQEIISLVEQNKEYERAIGDLFLQLCEAEKGKEHIFLRYELLKDGLFGEVSRMITEYSGVIREVNMKKSVFPTPEEIKEVIEKVKDSKENAEWEIHISKNGKHSTVKPTSEGYNHCLKLLNYRLENPKNPYFVADSEEQWPEVIEILRSQLKGIDRLKTSKSRTIATLCVDWLNGNKESIKFLNEK